MSRRVIESLVNTIVKSRLSETLLKFLDTPDEQEGYTIYYAELWGHFGISAIAVSWRRSRENKRCKFVRLSIIC